MYRKIVKVFLGSPGDLNPEREAAARVVQGINRNHAEFWNMQIELVGWEDTVSRFGRAQAVINQDLDQCEYFIGVMWQRWGTPPGEEGHPYSSGFEEEFCRSVERRETTGSPEISLLFKTPDEGRMQDPGRELTRVLDFKKEVITQKKIYFQDFRELSDFEDKFRALVISYAQRTIIAERRSEEKTEAGVKNEIKANQTTPDEAGEAVLLKEDANNFISEVLLRTSPSESVSAADVARLRLIASSVHRGGNDATTLGAHDANLIFKKRDEYRLTSLEVSALVVSGAAHRSSENVPLWGWAFKSEDGAESELVWQSLMRDVSLKPSLIRCLTIARFGLSSDGLPLTREHILPIWLQSEADDVKTAAIEYLQHCGTVDDIPLLEPLFSSAETAISERAVIAAIVIRARVDKNSAIRLMVDYPSLSVPSWLVTLLFSHPEQIKTEILLELVTHKSSALKSSVIEILFSRDAIGQERSNSLLSDESANTRYLALNALASKGLEFTIDDARKILVRTGKPTGLGLYMGASNTEGEDNFAEFASKKMQALSKTELLKLHDDASVYDRF